MSNAHGDHERGTGNYWTPHHTEPVVLDIGEDVGAVVLYTSSNLHAREIEVSPIGDDMRRVHTAVLGRSAGGWTMFAAVYPELRAGAYHIWADEPPSGASSPKIQQVTIAAGTVAEVLVCLMPAEATFNSVNDFRVYRPKEGDPEGELAWRPHLAEAHHGAGHPRARPDRGRSAATSSSFFR